MPFGTCKLQRATGKSVEGLVGGGAVFMGRDCKPGMLNKPHLSGRNGTASWPRSLWAFPEEWQLHLCRALHPHPPTPRCLKRSCLRRESFRPRDSPEPACLLRRRRTEPRQRAQGSCGLGLLSSCAELKGAVFLRLRGQISNCSHNSDEYSP